MTFDELKSTWAWRPIPHCPGRFVLAAGESGCSPAEMLGPGVALTEIHAARARDPVLVARLRDGGLISYRKTGRTFLHTLNTTEGFERKLAKLGIVLAWPSPSE